MDVEFLVRPVRASDLSALAEIEALTWRKEGAHVLSEDDLRVWFEEQSPLFLVSEHEGRVCGYYFGRFIEFTFAAMDDFIRGEIIHDGSWHRHYRHAPGATTAYGLSTASVVKGAGTVMSARARSIWKDHGIELCIGFTRLNGLDAYLKSLGTLPYPEAEIALWYAHESAKLLGLRSWGACTPQPSLELPPPAAPDPVLAFHARGNPIGLLRVVPGYMPDTASRNYGAFIALDPTDIT